MWMDKLEKRQKKLLKWLRTEHPEVFEEQKHLDSGSPERAYWHHRYMMALRDVLNQEDKPNGADEEVSPLN